MPAVLLETNAKLSKPEALAKELSNIVANSLNKPEKYVTVSIRSSQAMTRGGVSTKFAFIEVRSIGGLNLSVNNILSKEIGKILMNYGIVGSKIYINFMYISPENWGKYTGTFG